MCVTRGRSQLDPQSRSIYFKRMTPDPTLARFGALVGDWTTEATHPMMPGVVVHGTMVAEWLEGERFLSLRAHKIRRLSEFRIPVALHDVIQDGRRHRTVAGKRLDTDE